MNCWKTIRVTHDFGHLRLFMYSTGTMLLSFLFYYLVVSSILKSPELKHVSFTIYVGSIIFLVIIHQILHLIPIWICRNRASYKLKWMFCVPMITIKSSNPLSRNLYLISLMTPLIVLTCITVLSSVLFPMYLAYISILSSIHFGLSLYDLIYASYLMKAPKKCFIENHSEGYHILIKQAM